jgi:hypothetical protein
VPALSAEPTEPTVPRRPAVDPGTADPVAQPAEALGQPAVHVEGVPQVKGVIRGTGNVPLAGVFVCLEPSPGSSSCAGSATTVTDGSYAIDAPAGSYIVFANDPSGTYVPGFWRAAGFTVFQAQADIITVTTIDVTGIDITEPLFPFVRGTFTNASGDPVEGVEIGGAVNAYTHTHADGTFAIKIWPNSSTTLQIFPTNVYRYGWYAASGFVTDQSLATTISVGDNDVLGINLVIPTWPRITGHVTDISGDPVASLAVTFYTTPTAYESYATTTDSNGEYVAYARNGGNWSGDFGDPLTWAHQAVIVNADSDVVRDVVLHRLPVVSGQIVDSHGSPVVGFAVSVAGGQSDVKSVSTDGSGHFSITWQYMTTPSVLVSFTDPGGTYVNGSFGPTGFVANALGNTTTYYTLVVDEVLDASITLPAYVHLSGHVGLEGGTPVSGGSVTARKSAGTGVDGSIGVDGSFSIKLAPGSYSLVVPGGYYGQEGFAYESGAVESIVLGDTDRDIDVVLPAGNTIQGRVTIGGVGIAGVEVDVYLAGTPFTSGTTASDGTWSIHVPPGAYLVGFYDGSGKYGHGWYGPAGYTSDPIAAKLVGVGPSNASGINVTLPTTKRVSGNVVDALNGTAIAHAFVEAFVNDVFYSSQYASSTGFYNLPVAPGKVKLWVYDASLRYAPGWRTLTSLTANSASALITTVGSSNVTGVKIRAPQAVVVTMTVGWAPAPGSFSGADATVEAFAYGAAASFDVVNSSGTHHMPVLKGSYRLWVDANSVPYSLTDGWYKPGTLTPDPSAATLKTFTANAAFDVTIPTGHGVSGIVRDKDGNPISGIDVQLYANGSFYLDTISTGGDFSFVVPPGTYRMAFADEFGLYRPGWLGSSGFVSTYASARNLIVTSNADLSGLTINLPMDTPPTPPTAVIATPYHQSASVAFTPSAVTLTRPIIHYAVTASPGGRQCITVNTPMCVVTGLTNGTSYTFRVTASSMVGSSSPSSPSAPVVPAPVPNAPGSPTTTPSGSTVGISWVMPGDNGSSITGYVATLSPGGRTCSPTPATDTGCSILAVADGRYTVSIRATNAAGTGPAATVPVTVDTTAPVVSAPSTSLRSGLSMSGASVPVTVAWGASDAVSGVADTSLELASGAGAYADQGLALPTTASLQRSLSSSVNAYRFRDRAVDASGNLSAWATGPATYVSLRQETGTGIVYHGSWASAASSSALGGRLRSTTSMGAYVTYAFTGRGFSFVSRKGTTSGKASIYIDGVYLATVDLYASTTTMRWVAYAKTYATSTKHVLKIVNLATSGRPRLYLDGFATIR